jgi:hypothetical protein
MGRRAKRCALVTAVLLAISCAVLVKLKLAPSNLSWPVHQVSVLPVLQVSAQASGTEAKNLKISGAYAL